MFDLQGRLQEHEDASPVGGAPRTPTLSLTDRILNEKVMPLILKYDLDKKLACKNVSLYYSLSNFTMKINQCYICVFQDGETTEKLKYFGYYPIDWSLRTKARFISSKPFSWSCQMSSAEECSGTVGFVKGMDTSCSQENNVSVHC